MLARLLGTLLVLGVFLASSAEADDVIKIRVSIKVITNSQGNPPASLNLPRLQAIVSEQLKQTAPDWWRGYEIELVEPVKTIGGPDPAGPSQYLAINFIREPARALDFLRASSRDDPAAYGWRDDAINVFVNEKTGDGLGGYTTCYHIPSEGLSACAIHIGAKTVEGSYVTLHEIGHFFDLPHTQGEGCNACDPMMTGTCHTVPGDDGFADTLPDLECWNLDDIANNAFGRSYNQLSAGEQQLVLDVFQNVMSYHISGNRDRLTELQLDHWADVASGWRRVAGPPVPRTGVVDGRTVFADVYAMLTGVGSSTEPFTTVEGAVAVANAAGTDIVMLLPGRYVGPVRLERAVTLRATRRGSAVLGEGVPGRPTFVLAWTAPNGAVTTLETNDLSTYHNQRVHATDAQPASGPAVAHDDALGWMLLWRDGPELRYTVGLGGLEGDGSGAILWQMSPNTVRMRVVPAGSPALAYGAGHWLAVFQRSGGTLVGIRTAPGTAASWERPAEITVGPPAPQPIITSLAPALAYGRFNGADRFLLVFVSGGQARLTTSLDGVSWTPPTEIGPSNKDPGLALHEGRAIVALGRTVGRRVTQQRIRLVTSGDGRNWRDAVDVFPAAINATGPGFAFGVVPSGACRMVLTEQVGGALGGGASRIRARTGRTAGGCDLETGLVFKAEEDITAPAGGTIAVGNSGARTAWAFGRGR